MEMYREIATHAPDYTPMEYYTPLTKTLTWQINLPSGPLPPKTRGPTCCR